MSLPDPKVILIQILAFILVVLTFKWFLFGPILNLLDSRRKEIEDDYEKADSTKAKAEQYKAEYEKRLANVEEEIRQIKAAEVKDAQRMKEEILSDARIQSEKILAKAEAEIANERAKAVVEMRSMLADMVCETAGKLIGSELDPAKHSALIDRFIADLDKVAK